MANGALGDGKEMMAAIMRHRLKHMLEGLQGELGGALHLPGRKGNEVLGNGSEKGKEGCWPSDAMHRFSAGLLNVCSLTPWSLRMKVSGQEAAARLPPCSCRTAWCRRVLV